MVDSLAGVYGVPVARPVTPVFKHVTEHVQNHLHQMAEQTALETERKLRFAMQVLVQVRIICYYIQTEVYHKTLFLCSPGYLCFTVFE